MFGGLDFRDNLARDNYRRFLLNGIAWAARHRSAARRHQPRRRPTSATSLPARSSSRLTTHAETLPSRVFALRADDGIGITRRSSGPTTAARPISRSSSVTRDITRKNVAQLEVGVDVSHRRRARLPVQSRHRRRRDVRAGEEQLAGGHRRASRARNSGSTPTCAASPIAASTTGRARTARTADCCSRSKTRCRPSMRAPASPSCRSARTALVDLQARDWGAIRPPSGA